MQKRKVIIVGGGSAGLSAAHELCREDIFEVHLIEKSTQLGGRVRTCVINEQELDVGGFLIYPWYDRYHELIDTLGIGNELAKIPPASDYFVNELTPKGEYHEKLSISFKEILEIFVKLFPNQFLDRNPTEPRYHAYDDLTIADYIKGLHFDNDRTEYYLSVFDTYLQGYCYGSVYEHKMAFMAATLFQSTVNGDMHASSYLRNGSKVFIDALSDSLLKKGVQIHLNCALESMEDKKLITNIGPISFDEVILCHTPNVVSYTNFITATVSFSGPARIENNADWGSCFIKEDKQQLFPVLSMVNLEKLYGENTAQHLNLNIKVNATETSPISSKALLEYIKPQLKYRFDKIENVEIVNRVNWKKAMPIAQEDYVSKTLQMQGAQNIYYAGDFLGCPSMETALVTGKRAANHLMSRVK